MRYSFCFCYRNREAHMNIVLPRIQAYMAIDCEFIVVEQNDDKKFRRGNLLNEAVKAASGDIVVLHDIDFYPVEGAYWDGESDIYRPVTEVVFTKNDLTDRPIEDIPRGFFNIDPVTVRTNTNPHYYGGVITFKKELFYKIGGYNPYYVGWGHEDDDLGFRIAHYNLTDYKSKDGLFYLLEHPDSTPPKKDPDYINNYRLSFKHKEYLHMGITNQKSQIEEVKTKHPLVNKWILATGFDEAPQLGEIEVKPGVWI